MNFDDENYYNDSRVKAKNKSKHFEILSVKGFTAKIKLEDYIFEECENISEIIDVPFKYEVCDLCCGKGKHVNPNIDCHGLTDEDFQDDPDFYDTYISGKYDEICYNCHGEKVVMYFKFPDDIQKIIEDYELGLAELREIEDSERRFGA